jgi:glycerate kinase
MRIIIAPDSFKEALSAPEVCEAIARGIRQVDPNADIECIPLADGGEGTVQTLIAATGGTLNRSTVTGPLGEAVHAEWGMLGDGTNTAVIEMAAASGLALVPPDRRDPTRTTTRGTGELILAALDAGALRILLGIGGSATTDGGAGAAQAVSVTFLDAEGNALPTGLSGGMLGRVARIEMNHRDPRIARTPIRVACDVDNPLCGPRGAANVYGPQKGADADQVKILDRNLSHLADVIERDLQRSVRGVPGAGAAGGLGAGLLAFFHATLEPGIRLVLDVLHFAERIRGADWIITGEGRLDEQSMMGKVIDGVGHAGRAAGVPVVALVGAAGPGAERTLDVLDRYEVITPEGFPLPDALARTAEHLESTAARLAAEWIRT